LWIHGVQALPEGSYPLHRHVGAAQDIVEHGNAWLALESSPNINSLASFVYATRISFAMVALEVTDDFWLTVTQWVNLLGLVPKGVIRIRAFQLLVSIDCSVQSRDHRLRDEGSIMLVINSLYCDLNLLNADCLRWNHSSRTSRMRNAEPGKSQWKHTFELSFITKSQVQSRNHQESYQPQADFFNPSTLQQPFNPSTLQQPFNPSIRQALNPSTLLPFKPFEPFNPSTLPPINPSTLASVKPSTLQSFNPSTLQPFNSSTLARFNPSTLPFVKPSTLQPFKPCLQPFNTSTLQPVNPSTLPCVKPSTPQPFNPSTLQAFNPSTLQVMRASCTSLGSSYRGPQIAIFRFLKLFLPRTRV
jgi:hypothetical protein